MTGTYTYDAAQPTAKDRVRGLIGDVDSGTSHLRHRISDEVIAAKLAEHGGNELLAAIACARLLLASFAPAGDSHERAPGLGINLQYGRVSKLIADLERQARGGASTSAPRFEAPPPTGGPSVRLPHLGVLDGPVSPGP